MTLEDDRAELIRAVDDYRRIWPEPAPLSANLALAVRLLAEADSRSGDWEYGFADFSEPITWVHTPSTTRESVEWLWGPEARNELDAGRIVRRRPAGPWEVDPT